MPGAEPVRGTKKAGYRVVRSRIQKSLVGELEWLKQVTGSGQGLTVKWMPTTHKPLSGEVRGLEIFVYESDEGEALKTLRHEFVDFLVSQAIEPYKEIANALIKRANEDVYRAKEKVVEALIRLGIRRSG